MLTLLLTMASTPPFLAGIDSVPAIDINALDDDDEAALVAVANDAAAAVVARARAIRLLGRRRSEGAGSALAALDARANLLAGPLRGQLVLARAEHAFVGADTDVDAVSAAIAVADAAVDSGDFDAAAAAVVVFFFVGGDVAAAHLRVLGAEWPALRPAVDARLRQWARSGAWRAKRLTQLGGPSLQNGPFAPTRGDVLEGDHGDLAPPR